MDTSFGLVLGGTEAVQVASPSDLPSDLLETLQRATRVVVFTGAGMSKDSGLDTFRDAQTGIWENLNPQDMASLDSWARDPDLMYAWYQWRGHICNNAQPNPGHHAITEWQSGEWAGARGVQLKTVTQNVDNLHERAGTTNVTHLHGSLFTYRCSICHKPARTPEFPTTQHDRITPPNCSLCGNPIRPGVVWFGEPLPPKDWDAADQAMQNAELIVIVGTSGVVYPAAGLPAYAKEHGAKILEISPERTDLTGITDWSLRATAVEGLPWIVDAARGDDVRGEDPHGAGE